MKFNKCQRRGNHPHHSTGAVGIEKVLKYKHKSEKLTHPISTKP